MFREMLSLIVNFVREFARLLWLTVRYHWKKLIVAGVLACVAFLGLILLVLKATASPKFCASCHNMEPYIESWRESSHREVNCIECHFQPGFFNELKGKWKAQMHVWMKLTGTEPPKPHTQISDASCLREGCHSTGDLAAQTITFKGVRFSHRSHLGELRRGKKLRCVSCHSQIVQGEHLTVTEGTCFVCHFMNREDNPELADCRGCHTKTKLKVFINANENMPFVHQEYLDRGVPCQQCHFDVIFGDGHLKDNTCVQCHAEPRILYGEHASEEVHRKHVTDYKVECLRCHAAIEHYIVRPGEAVPEPVRELAKKAMRPREKGYYYDTDCLKCHSLGQHEVIRNMYQGSGAEGVPQTPNPMYLAHADCGTCHVYLEKTATGYRTSLRLSYDSVIRSCLDCHGPGYDVMAKHWKKLLTEELDRSATMLAEARQVVRERKTHSAAADALKELEAAERNLAFVRNGRGLHNMDYALKILANVQERAERARALVTPGYAMREVNPPTGCTQLCHSCVECIETKPVPFGNVQFPHDVHVQDEGMECLECHSPREEHGQTFLRNCNECHHGEGMGAVECQDCHVENHNLYNGQNACDERSCDVRGEKNPMAEAVECADCHTQVAETGESSVEAIKQTCVDCHDGDEGYAVMVDEWNEQAEKLRAKVDELRIMLTDTQRMILKAIREGKYTYDAQDLVNNAEKNLKLFERGNPVHNLAFSEELLERVRNLLLQAQKTLKAYTTIRTLPRKAYL